MAEGGIFSRATAFAWHVLKNSFLVALSLFLLPIDTAVIFTVSLWSRLTPWIPTKTARDDDNNDNTPPSGRKTVLITGMSMSKGLVLARLFHRRGHRVIGADAHPLAMGRVSSSLDRFYVLPTPGDDKAAEMEDEDDPYILRLLDIVRDEDVDLWVSVSDVNNAMRDGLAKDVLEAHTDAKAIQLGPRDVRSLHEKDAFVEHTRRLGLPVPESEVVSSRAAVIDFLNKRGGLRLRSNGKQYILKPIRVDDATRNDAVLLPAATEQETLRRLDSVAAFNTPSSIARPGDQSFAAAAAAAYPDKPELLMQEFIRGREFCTHALVVKGRVRAFTACPSSGLLMHYTAMPEEAPLCGAMLAFTRIMAGAEGGDWTGHVSFDFIAKGRTSLGEGSSSSSSVASPSEKEKGRRSSGEGDPRIYPIECNPRVHTAIVLFNDTPEIVDEYLSVLDGSSGGIDTVFPSATPEQPPKQYYWLGQDLIEHVVYPLYLHLVSRTVSRAQLAGSVREFVWHVKHWKDGTFEVWDPWPWWWLYHVYWPARFMGFLLRDQRWSGLNVSTGKAFMAR